MFVTDVDSVEPQVLPSGSKHYSLISAATNDAKHHSVSYFEFVPGAQCHKHHHPEGFEESYYIIEGVAEVHLEDEVFFLNAGQSILIPPLRVHGLVNSSSDVLKFLVITTPPWTRENFIASV